MTTRRAKTRARTAILAAAALVPVLALTGCRGAFGMGHSKTSQQSYNVSGSVHRLTVDSAGGNVDVVAGPSGGGVHVVEKDSYQDRKPVSSHELKSGTLALRSGRCGASWGHCDVSYTVTVPRTVDVELRTSGGDVTASGLSGAVAARTDGGNISVRDDASSRLTASTSGGDVEVAFSRAPATVSATSDGGSVKVTLPGGGGVRYAVHASTAGGSKSVTVPQSASSTHRVTAHSSGGDVTVGTA
ncbi:hypothetical protein BIV57_13890 [Mangrovactinospora gilvigrisea]|uniref:DUF4097 domain-containing protein n=1 Tax=Mangrovactinospora gilvigrisea TaxID=1428644 RepID=A0A1J7BE42_9ACTN|nr:DUF4097 family beta strand repeat-containing protein [Mangrovactinospora gilvigrisea]OIV36902.1 hypothetical protein BIV57_13890 [Mangrovactinospora gilvigrisea]